MPTTSNATCAITNQRGNDILVSLNITGEESSAQHSVAASNGQLEFLLTEDGSPLIKSGTTRSVTLDRTYNNPPSELSGDVGDYDLLVSDSTWIYPLVHLHVEKGSGDAATYPAQTVNADNAKTIAQAMKFVQTTAACPTSKLAKDYKAMLDDLQDAVLTKADSSPDQPGAVADVIPASANAFFAATGDYKGVTLADVVAVDQYYSNFPFVWARYKKTLTYYIYGSDSTSASFEGTLVLRLDGAADPAKENGGMSCVFNPAANPADTSKTTVNTSKAVKLNYANGLFTDDGGAAQPGIALKGHFMLKSFFTGQAEENDILQIVTGNIHNRLCIGFDAPQPTARVQASGKLAMAASPVEQYWNTLTHPKNQNELLVTIFTFAGAALVIPAVAFAAYQVYKLVKWRMKVAERTIVEHRLSGMTEKQIAAMEVKFGKLCGVNKDIFVEMNFKNVEAYEAALLNDSYAVRLHEALEAQLEAFRQMLQYGPQIDEDTTQAIQDGISEVTLAKTTLNKAKRTELADILPEQMTNFSARSQVIRDLFTTIQNHFRDANLKAITDSETISNKVFSDLEKTMDNDIKTEESTEIEVSEIIEIPT